MLNIVNLPEEEIEQIKTKLIDDGKILTKKLRNYDKKFFQLVLTSAKIIKVSLFVCFTVYVLLNLFGIILSVLYKTFNLTTLIVQIVVCCAVTFICFIIFGKINTNKKIEKEVVYIKNGNFIFNFNNGIVKTPNLFYCLPYENIERIEFEIFGIVKHNSYGRVIFTFNVLDYHVTHTVNLTDLTEIEDYITQTYPQLSAKIIKDGNSEFCGEKSKRYKINCALYLFGCLIVAALFIIIPLLCNYFNLALLLAGSVCLLTATLIAVSPLLYTYHLQQGLVLSVVFIIIGYGIPLFIIMNSGVRFDYYLASNSLVLLPTFFGNIGLIVYAYIVLLIFKKMLYRIKTR